MVNNGFMADASENPERRMILSYAPANARAGLAALLALDDALAAILRSTREPMVGQMRLTWWHEALTALDSHAPPAEPVLQALARDVMPHVTGAALARMIDGWEELLDPDPLDDARMLAFARARGGGLFAAAGVVLGVDGETPIERAGRGWALADLSRHLSDPGDRKRAAALATVELAPALATSWPRRARALGAMAHLAAMPVDAEARRVARALWHRLTGR